MTILNALTSISAFYYAASIAFIYSSFLTPKDKVRHPRTAAFLIMSAVCFMGIINFRFITYGLLVSMSIVLLLYKDSFSRRLTGFIIAYMTQLTSELVGVNIYNLIYYLEHKTFPVFRTTSASEPREMFGTVSIIILCGIIITVILTKYLKKWFRNFRTSTLSLIGLPLIITMVLFNLLVGKTNIPHYYLYLAIICCLYLICYFPITVGFRRIQQHEKKRAELEKHRTLIQEQLAYSHQMEEEYQKLRKWKHDISNHIIAISYLLDNERYQEGIVYLETLLNESDCNQKKDCRAHD